MATTCPHCNAKVSRIADHCGACNGKLVPDKPWYIYLIGACFGLLLFLWAVDFGAVYRILDRWISGGTTAP
ncbi:MAG: hypothetical protein SGJ07_04335 [Rhodospirillaceae bacterium]|nr:hypothetical protein [Rhodospirillaceae bacterium]